MTPKLGKKGESPKLVIRVSAELLQQLKHQAEKDRRTVSDFTRLLIEDGLSKLKTRMKS
jgi:predicted DNA-binding protein